VENRHILISVGTKAESLIGRSRTCHITIDDDLESRKQCPIVAHRSAADVSL
jgi:pSer/pThr/pTyr-binding forkhead associated (FHA) protein